MDDLLSCRPILHSTDIERTRAFLGTRAIHLEPLGDARASAGFNVRYNGLYLPRLWLGYIRYGAAVEVRVSPTRDDYWVHFPIKGRLSIGTADASLDIGPSRAGVTSPSQFHRIRSDAQGARLSLSINGEALRRHLADLLNDAPAAPLELARAIDLQAGFGLGFAQLLRAIAHDVCASGSLAHPRVAHDFEQLVLTSLLLSVPHTHTEALRRCERRVAPRDVRRAVDFMIENARHPIGLADLVQASGVPGRTLLQHFRDAHGVSPMRFLRNHRLQRVRDELLGVEARSVSETALRWGFAHFGRFAAMYRARFGESPSSTLARGRLRNE